MIRCTSQILIVCLSLTPCLLAGPVRIQMHRQQELTSRAVTVSNIATVSDGDLITRRKIAKLDITELKPGESTKSITRRQVRIRILLAGVSSSDFQITGSRNTEANVVEPATAETRILDFLSPVVAAQLGVERGDVQLQLAKPLPPQVDSFFVGSVSMEHTIRSRPRLGIVSTQIRLRKDGRLVRTLPLSVDVQVFKNVLVVQRPVEVGAQVAEPNVRSERRLISGPEKFISSIEVGSIFKRKLNPGDLVLEQHIGRAIARKREMVIRPRDVVEIVARSSSLQARISGALALQRGAPGDVIRVKNPSSGKVLTATVVAAGIVEIQL